MGRKREEETMRDGERHRDRRGGEDKGESERDDNRKRGNEYECLPSGNCCSIWLEHGMKIGTYNKR